jgi:general stress protein 26
MLRDAGKTIGNLIDKQGVAFIGSVDGDGFPNAKAMLPPRKREGLGTFYFSTNTSSMRVAQYRSNPKACLYFCDRRFFRGVMLKGTMEVLEDTESKEMIWRAGDQMYYPKGVTDPDYCVLRFTARSGRYYSNFSSQNFAVE